MKLAGEGRYEEAFRVILSGNVLPWINHGPGRPCHHCLPDCRRFHTEPHGRIEDFVKSFQKPCSERR